MPIIVSTSTGTARPGNFAYLKSEVARIMGGQDDPVVLAAAGSLINRRILQMNSWIYECNKLTSATITTSSGTADYALPSAFYKENEAMVTDSSGTKLRQLNYIPWEEYQEVFTSTQSTNQRPVYYTLFNVHATGNVRLLPTPDSTSYVVVTYFRRLSTLTTDEAVLDAPQEIEVPIVLGAQTDLLREMSPAHPALARTEAAAERAWRDFKFIESFHPDEKPRFRLAPLYGYRAYPWPFNN